MKRTWPQWLGYVTAAVSLIYAMLGVFWSLGGAGFPFGVGDPEMVGERELAIHANVLGMATPEVAGPIIAGLGLLGTVVALAMVRGWGGGVIRRVLLGFGIVTSAGLAVVVQDYRALIVVAYTPILLIGKLFGGFEHSGFAALYRLPRLHLLTVLLLGLAWAMTTVVYWRRGRGGCGNCGRTQPESMASAVKWGRKAVAVAVVTPLIYCATRWAWALGFSLGIDPEFYRQGQEDGLWLAGAALATMGAAGAILTLGLIQRWGEIFPRWMIGLRGKPVPPMLAVIPATTVAVLVTSAGFMYIRMTIGMGLGEGGWATTMPETLWPIWGAGLFVAAIAYHQRRRGTCKVCGRGRLDTVVPAMAKG